MVDQLSFTANAYMVLAKNSGKASSLMGKELRCAKNQTYAFEKLKELHPDVFTSREDIYKVRGLKCLSQKDKYGYRPLRFIIENTSTGKRTNVPVKKFGVIFNGVHQDSLAAFDVVGSTLKEKIAAKTTAVKKFLHMNKKLFNN